ncbi:MAG: restriction endonuclease subunit S [Candidatus Sedimenticola sp. (ex Thyasira tokunagai)]
MKEGWIEKKLSECFRLKSGDNLTSKAMNGGHFPVYGGNGIAGMHDDYNLSGNNVIVGRVGALCGIARHVTEEIWLTDNAFKVVDAKYELDNKFLTYLLNYKNLRSLARQAAQPVISNSSLKCLQLTFPGTIPEQQRIVAILDEAFEGIAAATANAEQNLKNARELFEGYLHSAFDIESEDWELHKLGDKGLLTIVDGDRGTNYPKKADFLNEGHCVFLNTKNVRPDGFSFDVVAYITEEKDQALRKGKLRRQDVILTTRGTIGNLGLYDQTVPYDHVRINSGMLILRPQTDKLLPEYLFEVMRSGFVKKQISARVSGAAQPQLPIKTLNSFDIPVPKSMEAQVDLVSKIRNLESETKRLEAIYQQKLDALAELKQSLLHKAFAGELH